MALAQAQAALAQTVREVRTLYVGQLDVVGQHRAARGRRRRARSAELARAEDDLARRQTLAESGAVSGEEMNHAQIGASATRAPRSRPREAALTAARQQLATNQSLTEGTTVEKHPNVERAAAKVREAYLAYARADAAVAGVGLRRQAHGAGRPARRAGRAADVDHSARPGLGRRQLQGSPAAPDAHRPAGDADGRRVRQRVEYHGTVAGLGVGTGSAFALLPAQNATGNWIKVVQRVPVRIALDPKELADASAARRPVDGSRGRRRQHRAARRSPRRRATAAAYTTTAFTHDTEDADALVRKTIAANLGTAAQTATAARRRAPRRRHAAAPAAVARTTRAAVSAKALVAARRSERSVAAPRAARVRWPRRRPPTPRIRPQRRAAAAPRRSRRRCRGSELVAGTIALSTATFMIVLDTSIANVSIPAISGDLGVSTSQGTWVITSFAVANAIAVPLTGWLTQRFGAVRLFTAVDAAVRPRVVAVRPRAEHRDR